MVFAPWSPNVGNLVQWEHPKIPVDWGWGSLFSTENMQYLWNGARCNQDRKLHNMYSYLGILCAFDLYQNQWPWMTVNGHYTPIVPNMRLSEPTTKIWMKIDPQHRGRTWSSVTVVSCDVSFMWIFAGVPWRGASNDSGVIENVERR